MEPGEARRSDRVTFSPKPFMVPRINAEGNVEEVESKITSLLFEVGSRNEAVEITSWPYTTDAPDEIIFLRGHKMVQEDGSEEIGPSASDAAQELAREKDVPLTEVEGSGSGGNITKEDVSAHTSSKNKRIGERIEVEETTKEDEV